MRSTTAPIARRRGRIAGRLRRKRDADAWHALGLLDRGGCMASWSRPVAVGIFPSRGHRRARAPSDVTFRCPDPWPDDIIRRLSGPSPIAQSVERRTVNPQVPGSSPGRGANRINRLPAVPGAHSQRAIRRNPWPVRRGSSKWPGADAQQFRVRRKVAIRPIPVTHLPPKQIVDPGVASRTVERRPVCRCEGRHPRPSLRRNGSHRASRLRRRRMGSIAVMPSPGSRAA